MLIKLSVVFVIIASFEFAESQTRELRKFREFLFAITGRSINDPMWFRAADIHSKIQQRIPDSVKFPCSDDEGRSLFRSKTKPSSVHMLRPGDIDVVGAIGDSLTVANGAGASNILQILSENRGVSWSIGGSSTWREFLTLPNILKVFNPKLVGFSTADSLSHERPSQFNVAELAAMSKDLSFMVHELVRRIKNDPRVDLQKDWKVITILIGANDFCYNFCYTNPFRAVEIHKKELNYTLTYLMNNLPRTFVNLVPAPDVQIIKSYKNKPPQCNLSHGGLCPCFHNVKYKKLFKSYGKAVKLWQQVEKELSEATEFSKEDFTIVYQPFDLNPDLSDPSGNTDFSLLSTDCFHFSQKGHAMIANALWNAMMEPVGKKSTAWMKMFERFLCPTPENPYLKTSKNSIYLGNVNYSDGLANYSFRRSPNLNLQ